MAANASESARVEASDDGGLLVTGTGGNGVTGGPVSVDTFGGGGQLLHNQFVLQMIACQTIHTQNNYLKLIKLPAVLQTQMPLTPAATQPESQALYMFFKKRIANQNKINCYCRFFINVNVLKYLTNLTTNTNTSINWSLN
jgi:hypothetical protein